MSNTDLLSGDASAQAAAPGDGESQTGGAASTPKRRPGGLSGMVIADLRALATELGIGDTTGMRKGDLIAAIRERQGKNKKPRGSESSDDNEATEATLPLGDTNGKAGAPEQKVQTAPEGDADKSGDKAAEKPADKQAKTAKADQPAKAEQAAKTEQADKSDKPEKGGSKQKADGDGDSGQQGEGGGRRRRRGGSGRNADGRGDNSRGDNSRDGGQDKSDDESGDQRKSGGRGDNKSDNRGNRGDGNRGDNRGDNSRGDDSRDDDERGGRRGRRYRDRRRRGGRGEGETEVREDDVLLPVAGILDVLDNYAFVRTSGYLPGPNDVYVSLSLVRKHGLRRGDAITGAVRQPREGEQQRQKFNPLVRVDSVNGLESEVAKKRPEFTKLTPLYPNERLRLETQPNKLTTRVIDLVMPVGKGQRALIVSPPKAGKTTIMQDVANAITTNNPECHLMVVLVDERPEEVTDMQRSVNGEVIASTFDRPPSDHTTVAELSIERAKRLVEMGHDVVVLLDSITRLGRAYNLAAPASGRILSGGVDSTALFPPKRFLGAARNIEDGGSLTIFATAMVETGSTGDTVIFEEFKGTGNAELKLDRKIAERRVFPAVDVNPSGTRKEELLLSPDELAVTHKLHRVLHALDSQQAIDLLIDRLKKSKTNIEFLMQISKSTPGTEEQQ
ncbi:transcription termination factor Rho [Prauserella aidingensis]|uniref:transcription termination factor Rho n=1 Tax=Prauserella aidingensis TaxID=387890 RepID=UPI0020A41C27|nr:transcription termination factor Rho [Prauserella aidingensis]MCP2254108.1 transcription termination factor Rho [Prauserella aidingensis]